MLSKTKVKYIQSLGHKKRRDEEQVFIAEGPKIVSELLLEPDMKVIEIFALAEWLLQNPLPANIQRLIVTEEELEKITQLSTPNKVMAIFQQPKAIVDIITKDKWVLLLDGIQDPGNMGTIIRIADWFGIKQIICSHECASIYNTKVIQSSMASIARVEVLVTDLLPWINQHADCNYYAASLEGKDLTSMGKLKKGIIMIGNESKGLNPSLLAKANILITIPRIGKAESLNASVATGIILSHLV
jgi:TrmH family RNA methyltransferase